MSEFIFNARQTLWVEKYRPQTIEDCILPERIKNTFLKYVEVGDFPHIMLHGGAGVGKTTLARALCDMLDYDTMIINISNERGIDVLRTKIEQFATAVSLTGNGKCVILDEFDGATEILQKALRAAMEDYSINCRFILTCALEGTKVYTDNGIKLIENINKGDILLTNKSMQKNKALIRSVVNKILHFKTKNGNLVSVTPNHKFLVNDEWVRADEMSSGDRININLGARYGNEYSSKNDINIGDIESYRDYLLSVGINTNDNKHHLEYGVDDYIEKIIHLFDNDQNVNRAIARLTGYLFGDGGLSGKSIHFSTKNTDSLELVRKDLTLVFPHLNENILKILPNGLGSAGKKIQFTDKVVVKFFEYVGVPNGNKVYSEKMDLPYICATSVDFFRWFVVALYDCEGNDIKIELNNKTLSSIIMRMNTVNLDSFELHKSISKYLNLYFGIESNVKVKDYNGGTYNCKDSRKRYVSQFQITKQKEITNFLSVFGSYYESYKRHVDLYGYGLYKQEVSGYKFDDLDQWKTNFQYNEENESILDIIESISYEDGEFNVYDCSLSEDHSYVTNGFVSHNCNYPNRVIDAIHSRTTVIDMEIHKEEKQALAVQFLKRLENILKNETVEYERKALISLIQKKFPDFRSTLNELQSLSMTGITVDAVETLNKEMSITKLTKGMRDKNFKDVRQWVANNSGSDANILFRKLYDSLYDIIKPESIPEVIVILAQYQHYAVTAIDPEINMCACFIEIMATAEFV